jgi:hypothetical protein
VEEFVHKFKAFNDRKFKNGVLLSGIFYAFIVNYVPNSMAKQSNDPQKSNKLLVDLYVNIIDRIHFQMP